MKPSTIEKNIINRKRILITGGSGFIGSNLTRSLTKSDAEVFLLLRDTSKLWRIKDLLKKINVLKVDLLDKDGLQKCIKQIKPEVVFHLAAYGAYSYQNEAERVLNTNIFGTFNLITSLLKTNLELFVNTGSSSEYGFKGKHMNEDDLLRPNSFYSIAKASQTHMCNYYHDFAGFPVVTLRPFSVYGPYENPGRLIPNLMLAVINDKTLNMANGNTARDFIYVDDYIDACLMTKKLKRNTGSIYNIGSGKETKLKDLIKAAEKSLGRRIAANWNVDSGKSWDTNHWKADIHKAESELGFKTRTTLEEGLRKSFDWYKNHRALYENS